jgi:hypothetical protein
MIINDLRSELAWHESHRWVARPLSDITQIVVHHTAITPPTYTSIRNHIHALNSGHIRANEWPRIGYHYVIGQKGVVWHCNDLTHITYHSGNARVNASSVGVCLLGDYSSGLPPTEQLLALRELVAQIGKPAVGHKNIVPTQCPGSWWEEHRAWVNGQQPITDNAPHSKLAPHFQIGLPPWAERFFNDSGCRWAKLMDPGDSPPLPHLTQVSWVIRKYEDGPTCRAEVMGGAAGAESQIRRITPWLKARPWLSQPRYMLEHHNEPTNEGTLRTAQGRRATSAYGVRFTQLLKNEFGIRSVGGNLGVGHPEPNHAVEVCADPMKAARAYEGAYSFHEYNWPDVGVALETDPTDGKVWGWHMLRFRRTLKALRAAGVSDFPPLHLTEIGLDHLLYGIREGWQAIDNNPEWYVYDQLARYDSWLQENPLVKEAYIFTATPQADWFTYGIDEAAADVLARYIHSTI